MPPRKKIEIYSAGCPTCQETVEMIKRLAGDAHDVEIADMHRADVAQRAQSLGIHRVPAVVIDGRLASCCVDRGPDEAALSSAIAD